MIKLTMLTLFNILLRISFHLLTIYYINKVREMEQKIDELLRKIGLLYLIKTYYENKSEIENIYKELDDDGRKSLQEILKNL